MIHTVHKVSLNNGARGLFIDIPDASVMSFEINFRAGDYLVKRPKIETPHLMEHMLLGANQKYRKSKTFRAEFNKNGAYCNASTTMYDVNYQAECADFEWERITKLLFLSIDKPLFQREEFNSETGNVREELLLLSNNHSRHLNLAMDEAFKILSITDQERVELMENVKLKDIRSHYKKTHFKSNMRFVIGGKLPIERRQQIIEVLEEMTMPMGEKRLALPKERPVKIETPVVISNESVKNMYFRIQAFLKRKVKIHELYALWILNVILVETHYSKILGAARERGITYHINSGFYKFNGNTTWSLSTQISKENIEELVEIIVKEIKKIFDGKISDKDIKAAKQYSLGSFQRSGQTVGYVVDSYSYSYFAEEKVYDYYEYPKKIEAVTKKQITDVTRELFSQDIWGVGSLGSADSELMNKIRDKLSILW